MLRPQLQQQAALAPLAVLRSHQLDETRQLVSQVFCDHSLDSRQHELDYRHAYQSTGHLCFNLMSYGADVDVNVGALEDFYLVQLPLAGSDIQRAGGREIHSDHRRATVHSPGEALQMRWSADCRKLVVRFERETLEHYAANLFERELSSVKFKHVMNLDHPACVAWRNSAQHIFNELQSSPQLFELPLIRAQLEQTLMTTLLTWQPHNLREQLTENSPQVLPRHVKQACDFMQAHADQAITINELVAVTGVSGRTLFAGFEKFLGLSPMRYLKDIRLQRLREDLLDPTKPRSVTALATQWGFFQLGRMASVYRERYGETPRETIARAGGALVN